MNKKLSPLEVNELSKEWIEKGVTYVKAINRLNHIYETTPWEELKGNEPEEPKEEREPFAEKVIELLREANHNGTIDTFREKFPPAHAPFINPFLNKNGQNISHLKFVEDNNIVFTIGIEKQAYFLKNDKVERLNEAICGIGKSHQNGIFAIATDETITLRKGWQGEIIQTFERKETKGLSVSDLLPFNNGSQVILVTPSGIFLINNKLEKLILPDFDADDYDEEEKAWRLNLSMENATISHNNKFIVVGSQDDDHKVLDNNGQYIGYVGTASSYPHFCLFSKDDEQLISNSCHFYNGVTIGVHQTDFEGMAIEPYDTDDGYITLDENMRVYHGLATTQYYILGDANGYIRAIDKSGKALWKYFLGSTINGMTISDDEQTLWVACYSGIIHKLLLNKRQRDNHVIGNGQHFEEFRLLFWREETQVFKW